MAICLKTYLLPIFFVLIIVPLSHSKVIVFDRVTTVRVPINIRVLTRDGFFSAGGRMVEVYLDNILLKKILSGGDGHGYLKFIPQEPGLKEITAHSNSDKASGLLLVMDKNEKAIIIETESAFKDAVFSDKIRESSRKTLTSINENYKLIYLSRFLGKDITGRWLEKYNYPKSVILRWNGPNTLENLKKNSVQLHAIIGSPDVISIVKKQIEKRYSFEKTKDGKTVKDWDDILDLLINSPLSDPKCDLFDEKNAQSADKIAGEQELDPIVP
jgi:hypothetical protein